jgi:chromosome segregation ATPase
MNNKNLLIIALTGIALASASQIASGRDQDERNSDTSYRRDDNRDWDHDRGDRIDNEINHLNRMVKHVEREMKRYATNWRIRKQFQEARDEVRRLNYKYHNSEQNYDRRRLRARIEEVRNDLRRIERDLHVRASEWYQWR